MAFLLMSKTVLFARPDYDVVTSYFFYWTSKLILMSDKKGYKALDLHSNRAVRNELEGRLKKMKPELCVINAHGATDRMVGHDNNILIDESSVVLLKDTIMYARSCNTGASLGHKCIAGGMKSYIGYTQPFFLPYDKNMIQKPLNDKVAKYALLPSNQVVISLLKGKTTGEASSRSKEASRKMMIELMGSNAPDGANTILTCVWANMKSQVCLGDMNSTI